VLNPLAAAAANAVMRVLFRLKVDALDKLPPDAPYIIAPNHTSALDPIAVAAAIGSRRLGQTFWGGWVGILFRSKLTSSLSHSMRILPVEPRSGPISNLALAAGVLHHGHNLVWFPEGQRAADGKLKRFRPGIGLLLRATPVTVVPAWIEGAGEALPPGRLWPRLKSIKLKFGDPCKPETLEREGEGATAEERIASALQVRVAALGAVSDPSTE
jgi:long-chain acyl-CoA synthetase